MLKEKVLYMLERQRGDVVTGGRLAGALGVSRTAVWKAINLLKDEGNEIVSIPNSGYRLLDTNDTLFDKVIRERLTTAFIGRNMILLPTVHSTNQYIKELDAAGVPDGFVVIADEQTSGRGRRGRAFLSPKSEGVYLSILLKPGSRDPAIRPITLCAAVAVCKAAEKVCGIRAEIKWVNDIYCNGKKLCGILTEAVISGELQELSLAVVGIGINTGGVPSEIGGIATSVREATGVRGVRNRLAAEVLNQFEEAYLDCVERGRNRDVIREYEKRLFLIGRRVFVTGAEVGCPATVLGVHETGALIVRDAGGDVRHITSGEIQLDWSSEP